MNHIKKKNSQVTSSVFLYALIALFIGVILLFGIKGIATLTNTGKEVSLENLKSDIKTAIMSQATKYMSVKNYEFNVPDTFSELCFVDSMEDSSYTDEVKASVAALAETRYLLIKDAIESDSKSNVFFLDKNGVKDSFYAESLDVFGNILCFENIDLIRIKLRGQGKTSLLTVQ